MNQNMKTALVQLAILTNTHQNAKANRKYTYIPGTMYTSTPADLYTRTSISIFWGSDSEIVVFMGHGFTSGGQESRSVFGSLTVCKYRLVSATLSAYHSWWKIKEAGWKVHCTAASWLCTWPPEVGHLIGVWKPSILVIYWQQFFEWAWAVV